MIARYFSCNIIRQRILAQHTLEVRRLARSHCDYIPRLGRQVEARMKPCVLSGYGHSEPPCFLA